MLRTAPVALVIDAPQLLRNPVLPAVALVPQRPAGGNQPLVDGRLVLIDHGFADRLASLQSNRVAKQLITCERVDIDRSICFVLEIGRFPATRPARVDVRAKNRYYADLVFFRFKTATIISIAITQSGIVGLAPGPVRGDSCSARLHSGTAILTNDTKHVPAPECLSILGTSIGRQFLLGSRNVTP